MKRILLLWHTINENFGDVLIYRTVKDYLEQKGYECTYMDVGRPCIEIIRLANNYDFLLFAGGGIIERYVPNVIRYFKDDYEELKVPYGIIGLSVGNFDYSMYSETIGSWINNAAFFYTRDEYSAKILNKIGKTTSVISGVDVVWSNDKIFRQINNNEKINIGINVRNIPYVDLEPDFNWAILKNCIDVNNINIQIPDESGIALEDLKQYKYSVEEVFDQISKCKLVIAMRYHVVLVAALMGIPVIPIVYCNKVHELSTQLNLSEYELNISNIEKISCKLEKMKINYDDVRNMIIEKSENMRKSSLCMLSKISDIILKC